MEASFLRHVGFPVFFWHKDYWFILMFCLNLNYKYHLLATIFFLVLAIGENNSLMA